MPLTSKHLFALALVALSLSGCASRREASTANLGDDDEFCQGKGVAVGSPDYVACRKDRDVQRQNAQGRTDRAQRNLGEYMLNNPSRP
ncbi:MAG: hypothetical protein HXX15_14530 [Rhodopseudomonas sp.]|uniref:hypothetical protein n=1 Tax=Rhodopseudomonas sp. TaxID=1078 RepID=UPI00180A21FC|nr:hypothetical protein [Rhodopseudomonas sp.]NVN87292.1 hypothetical protein [Rhodopseudomonas sp.]